MTISSEPVSRAELAGFLCQGVVLCAVTRDERRMIELVRCGGARIGDDGRVWLALPMPEAKRALGNIDATREIALTAGLPSDYRTVQLKGHDACRVAWPELAAVTKLHRERFREALAQLGAGSAGALLWSREFVAVAFTASEMFDQTPGPAAGLALTP